MKKKTIRVIALCLAVLMVCLPSLPAWATQTVDSLDEKIEEETGAIGQAKEELDALENTLDAIQQKKEQLENVKDKLTSDVIELDHKMTDVSYELLEVERLLEQKKAEIEQTNAALAKAKEDVDNQYENMKIRIKFMYEQGSTSVIEVLLGAASFSDLLNRADYIERLSAYDRDMLVQFRQTKEKVARLEKDLKDQEQVLLQAKADVEDKKSEMEELIADKRDEITDYDTDIENKEKAIEEYEQMIKEQDATIKALEASVAAAKAQKARLSVSENDVEQPYYSGGQFCWPAPSYTRISDDYGYRIHPTLGVQQFHNGVDMAAPSGSAILAAADGVVIAAAYSETMGNYIMIDHGGGLYTIYMHASALYVSTGSAVSAGNQIGAVGSTGRSTGPHLHFSVRLNGSYVSPWGYL